MLEENLTEKPMRRDVPWRRRMIQSKGKTPDSNANGASFKRQITRVSAQSSLTPTCHVVATRAIAPSLSTS
jgi:hypothetical protein